MDDDNDFIPIKMSELRRITAERDKFKEHSIILNSICWKVAKAIGMVPEGATEIVWDAEESVDILINRYLGGL